MKALFLGIALMVFSVSFSQTNFLPDIKQGSKLQYMALVNGQEVPLGIGIDSLAPDYLKISWSVEDYGVGAWIMNKKSLESASSAMTETPEPGVDNVLPDDKVMLVISRDQWNSVQKDKKMTHNGTVFIQATPAAGEEFKLGDKPVDVVYLETENKATKMWLLNNPALPLMLKVSGNLTGADLTALSVN